MRPANPCSRRRTPWDVSPDGVVYRFHLRPDARWSNGEPVVAEDFAAAWRRLVDPHTGAQYADILNPVRGATAIVKGSAPAATLGVQALDAQTLVVELVRPTPYFLDVLAHPATFPINRRSLERNGRRFAKPGVLVSNGAFVLERWGLRFASGRFAQSPLLERCRHPPRRRRILFVCGRRERIAGVSHRTGGCKLPVSQQPKRSGSGRTWGPNCT